MNDMLSSYPIFSAKGLKFVATTMVAPLDKPSTRTSSNWRGSRKQVADQCQISIRGSWMLNRSNRLVHKPGALWPPSAGQLGVGSKSRCVTSSRRTFKRRASLSVTSLGTTASKFKSDDISSVDCWLVYNLIALLPYVSLVILSLVPAAYSDRITLIW
jgi:hypothetical protein